MPRDLLGLPPPPEVPLAEAELSPQGMRFYAESKRVSNARAKAELGWRPAYPTYREGLAAILAGRALLRTGDPLRPAGERKPPPAGRPPPRGRLLAHRRQQPGDVLRPRQAVVAVLDQGEDHVLALDRLGQFQGVAPGHVGVGAALQDAHRDLDRHGLGAQDRPAGAVLQQGRG